MRMSISLFLLLPPRQTDACRLCQDSHRTFLFPRKDTPTLSPLTAQYKLSASPKLLSRTWAMTENCCPHRTPDCRVVLKEINSMLPLLARGGSAARLYVKGRREVERVGL